MKYTSIFIFVLILLPGCFVSAYATQDKTIVIDAENGAGPWGNLNGEGAGNDLIKAAFEAAGEQVKLQIVPYAICKKEVMLGTVVGCFAMSTSPMLEHFVVFANKPLYTPWAGIYATSNAQQVASVEELLKGHTIGIVYGYEYPASIVGLKDKGFDVKNSPGEDVLMHKLDKGQSDFAIFMLDDLKNIDFLLKSVDVKHPPIMRMKVPAPGSYIGFSLKHPDGRRVKKIFDEGFNKIIKSGEYQKIIDHWKEKTSGHL